MENLRINTVYVADIDTIAFPFDYDQDSVTQVKDFEIILSSFASLANVFAIPYNSVYVAIMQHGRIVRLYVCILLFMIAFEDHRFVS